MDIGCPLLAVDEGKTPKGSVYNQIHFSYKDWLCQRQSEVRRLARRQRLEWTNTLPPKNLSNKYLLILLALESIFRLAFPPWV